MNKITSQWIKPGQNISEEEKSGSGSGAGFYKRLQLRTAVPLHRVYAYFYVTNWG